MRWPDATREPLSRLRIRTKAVVAVLDDATGQPPARPPVMRMQRLGDGDPVDLDWEQTLTLGGAVLFSGHTDVDGARGTEHYRLVVEPDSALRPELPGGYAFTVGPDPARWPVRLVVRLLPGPTYAHPPRRPVVHGVVVEAGPGPERAVVADAVVAASEDGGATVRVRCGADHQGSFSLGLPTYRPSRPMSVRASAPDGAVGAWRALTPRDFERSVQLTVQR
jgi:hypothetical protein